MSETHSHRGHIELIGVNIFTLVVLFRNTNSVTCIDLSVTIYVIKSVNLVLLFLGCSMHDLIVETCI